MSMSPASLVRASDATPATPLAFQFHDVSFRYHQDHPRVLEGLTFVVPQGDFWIIEGANGAGKSTLLELAAGIRNVEAGQIETNVSRIEYLPQDYVQSLFPWHDVSWNICLPPLTRNELEIQRPGSWRRSPAGVVQRLCWKKIAKRHACRALAQALCQEVEVSLPLDVLPFQLSGGQQHLVTLLRAFASQPDLLLLDEPDAGLDRSNAEKMWRALCRFKAARPTLTVLCVSHLHRDVLPIPHKRYRLKGRPITCLEEQLGV